MSKFNIIVRGVHMQSGNLVEGYAFEEPMEGSLSEMKALRTKMLTNIPIMNYLIVHAAVNDENPRLCAVSDLVCDEIVITNKMLAEMVVSMTIVQVEA
jgi:hypothetical protein